MEDINKIKDATSVVKEYATEAEQITKAIISKDTLASHIISVVETFSSSRARCYLSYYK